MIELREKSNRPNSLKDFEVCGDEVVIGQPQEKWGPHGGLITPDNSQTQTCRGNFFWHRPIYRGSEKKKGRAGVRKGETN